MSIKCLLTVFDSFTRIFSSCFLPQEQNSFLQYTYFCFRNSRNEPRYLNIFSCKMFLLDVNCLTLKKLLLLKSVSYIRIPKELQSINTNENMQKLKKFKSLEQPFSNHENHIV